MNTPTDIAALRGLHAEAAEAETTFARLRARAQITEALPALLDEIERLTKAREIIELWFSPWGAAKGEMWEDLSGDKPFDPNVGLELIRAALNPQDSKESGDGVS